MFTSNFCKQTDGYTTGETEQEVVNPSKPKLYKRFVDDIINRRNKNQHDDLFQKLKATIQI